MFLDAILEIFHPRGQDVERDFFSFCRFYYLDKVVQSQILPIFLDFLTIFCHFLSHRKISC